MRDGARPDGVGASARPLNLVRPVIRARSPSAPSITCHAMWSSIPSAALNGQTSPPHSGEM